MLRRNLKYIQKICAYRNFHTSIRLQNNDNREEDDKELTSSVATRFKVFKNEFGVIFDIEEERAKRRLEEETGNIEEDVNSEEQLPSIYEGLNLERGKTGVYDIEDLVDLLRKENAIDLCVIRIPKELSYVDYMCIITGSSFRHMSGIASFVRKVYKLKRNPKDHIPKIEGKECKNWMAMDLGNIALHIFSKQTREHYSLETLWTLGEEYEKRTKKAEPVEDIYEQFLKPEDVKIKNNA